MPPLWARALDAAANPEIGIPIAAALISAALSMAFESLFAWFQRALGINLVVFTTLSPSIVAAPIAVLRASRSSAAKSRFLPSRRLSIATARPTVDLSSR